MKVLLVFAGIAETGFKGFGQKLKLVWINHGLASIAGSVRKAGNPENEIASPLRGSQ